MTNIRFAFAGRVSTEDHQDPHASRNWQLARARALTEPHGEIVAEFFDIGHSRSIPWRRRPEANHLLDRLSDPDRGFDAVVIGEPQRAFYGNQFGLTFPVFVHYGVQRILSVSCRFVHFGGRPAFLPRGSGGSTCARSAAFRSARLVLVTDTLVTTSPVALVLVGR